MSKLNISSENVVEQAIEWMVHFHSGEMTDRERKAFAEWRAERSSHEEACQQIEQILCGFPQLAMAPDLRQALEISGSRRQFLKNCLTIATIAPSVLWLYNRRAPLDGLWADIHTGTGERSTKRLPDGSLLTLNARSSVNFDFSEGRRDIQLVRGQIYVNAFRDRSPLRVSTADGVISLNEGVLTAAVRSEGTQLASLKQAAQVKTSHDVTSILQPGHGALINKQGIFPHLIAEKAERAWLEGLIEVNDQPLGRLIEAFRDYRTGIIRISDEASRLRVSGIFPLDDTDFSLDSLAQTLPVVIRRTTGYWISISLD